MAGASHLDAAFVRGRGRGSATDAPSSAIQAALASARRAHPEVAAPEERFAEALGAAVGDVDDLGAEVGDLCSDDLWVALAAAEGQAPALRVIDERLDALRPTVARLGADRAAIDDLLQRVRVRLLAGSPDRPPRIRSYRGRGSLRSWLKVIVVRDAIRGRRAETEREGSDELEVLMDPSDDPELLAMRGKARDAFRAAFEHALAELGARDRNVLRYHLAEGLTIDDLAALYRVHRATTARWLARIREALFVSTRTRLMQGLGVGEHEVDSVIRLIRSRLDTSIVSHLDRVG